MVVGKNLGGDSLQRWLGEQGYPTDAGGQRQGVPGAGEPAPVTEQWEDATFLADAVAWVDERLGELGRARTAGSSSRISAPGPRCSGCRPTDGPVWFKANTDSLRHEVLVVDRVSRRVPSRVPALLGRDLERGWMLMADAGERLREVVVEEQQPGRAGTDVLEGVADLHRALEPDVDELLAAGVPDLRLATLADGYAELVTELDVEPRFRDAPGRCGSWSTSSRRTASSRRCSTTTCTTARCS